MPTLKQSLLQRFLVQKEPPPAPVAPETWVPPGHFYSPLVDPHDPIVVRMLENFDQAALPDTEDLFLDEAAMLQLLNILAPLCADVPFPEQKTEPYRFYFDNPAFTYGDAAIYFGMLRWLRPVSVVEIGSGFSSCLAMDTNDHFFNRSIDLTFIEPFPDTLLNLLGEDDFYRSRLLQHRLQETEIIHFEKLAANDILFIDSSHVAKLGSDVNDYLFRIFPRLQSGVVIHIHDIPYPFEYHPEWTTKENRSWNEAYMLRAFLQYNKDFKVIYFNNLMFRRHAAELAQTLPMCLLNGGASIWLRKT